MTFRLSLMMFLQYFVQGCYLPIISVYVEETLKLGPKAPGYIGSALAVGPLLAPFVIGQLVDRKFATEIVLGISHLLGGLLMLALYTQTTLGPVLALGTLYSLLYVPTMMLTNSLAFHHLEDRERQFPLIRMWGTIGFIVPAWLLEFVFLQGLRGEAVDEARGVTLIAAGLAGLVMAAYSLLFLPHTPPTEKVAEQQARYAPRYVIGLLRRREILVLVVVSFFAAVVHKFHFVENSPFLKSLLREGAGQEGAWEASISSLGQVAEIFVMLGLAAIIARLGFKWTITLGLAAYMIRCLMFVGADQLRDQFAAAMTVACLGQTLHGLCFACFMATAYIFIDRDTPAHVRGTAQNLYGTFVIGLGFFVGGIVTSEIAAYFTTGEGDSAVRNFTGIWLSGAALAAACAVAFALLFPRQTIGSGVPAASPTPELDAHAEPAGAGK